MSAVGGGGNYMSDGAILAWVTQQQNRMYGDLEGTMQQQELQGQMASDLADIKQHLETLAKHPENVKDVDAELSKFIDAYGSNPHFEEIASTVSEIEIGVRAHIPADQTAASVDPGVFSLSLNSKGGQTQLSVSAPATQATPPPAPPTLDQETIKGWTDTLDKKLGAAGTNEQLGMVHINEVKSTIDQSTQIASQLIKSSNDSMSSVIHNIA
jgi:hypothetical protein